MYNQFKVLAKASGDPARLTKVNAIDDEAKARVIALFVGVIMPSSSEILANAKRGDQLVPQEVYDLAVLVMYGRNRCREMVNRPLPFVTSYNPNTDTEWPF